MTKEEILNDPICQALKCGEIGRVDNNENIDTDYAIKMGWMKKNIPFEFNVCRDGNKYRFYITDQTDWKNTVFKSDAVYEREEAYKVGIMKMLEIFEKNN